MLAGSDSGRVGCVLPKSWQNHYRADQQRDEQNEGRDVYLLWDGDFTDAANLKNVRLQPWVEFGIYPRADQHAQDADDRMARARADGSDRRPGAVPEDHHADAEDEAAECVGKESGSFDVQRNIHTNQPHRVDPKASDYDRGHHDLQDREVLEPELVDDDIEVGDPAFLQEEAKEKPCDGSEQECCWISKPGVHDAPPFVRRPAYSNAAVGSPPANIAPMKIHPEVESCIPPESP